jgi:dCMP deaminase
MNWFDNDQDLTEALTLCYAHARANSKDPNTQNGALIINDEGTILSVGVNTMPKGVQPTEARLTTPAKYAYMEHAERNAIYFAARKGVRIEGSTMVAAWAACADCARAIIISGIKRLIRHTPAHMPVHNAWVESIDIGNEMLQEAGVEVLDRISPLPKAPAITRSGELWQP